MSFGFCILGTGMISKDMRTALSRADDSVFLAAVGSRTMDVAKDFVSQYTKKSNQQPVAFGSYKEAIEYAGAKAVYIGLPTSMKEEIAMQCIAAGKHVLVDKPFSSAASVERMSSAANAAGLLFMDATHFVHCARTAAVKEKLARGVIGTVQHITVNFYAGAMLAQDNIRFDPKLEPHGAIGDLGWYTARAAIEYLVPDKDLSIQSVSSVNHVSKNGAITQGSSIVKFSNNTTMVSSVGFTGAWDQSLQVVGSTGSLRIKDFLLDHHNSGVFSQPWRPLQFEVFVGTDPEPNATYATHTPFAPMNKEPRALMFEGFARDAADATKRQFWATQSFRTQQVVDAMFHGKK